MVTCKWQPTLLFFLIWNKSKHFFSHYVESKNRKLIVYNKWLKLLTFNIWHKKCTKKLKMIDLDTCMYSFIAPLALLCSRYIQPTYDYFLDTCFLFSPFIKKINISIITNTKGQTKSIHFFQWLSPGNTYTINELFLKQRNDVDRSSDMFIGIEYDEKLFYIGTRWARSDVTCCQWSAKDRKRQEILFRKIDLCLIAKPRCHNCSVVLRQNTLEIRI